MNTKRMPSLIKVIGRKYLTISRFAVHIQSIWTKIKAQKIVLRHFSQLFENLS